MTRAVLDANVFVTAVLTPAGSAAAVLEAWRSERFALLVSQAILEELTRVLAYPKIARRHGWSRKEILTFVRDLADLAILTPGRVELSVIRADPDDDRYLLALGVYRDIAILPPRAFLAALPAARKQ